MDIAKNLLGVFRIKDVNSDNVTFKLFYKASFGLCLFSSLLVGATQNWGDPIECHQTIEGTISDKVFENHCWIHGTKRIESDEDQKIFNCKSRDLVSKKGNLPDDVTFYQWVTFMLLINAAIFRIPYIIWKFCEGGLMKSFYSDDTRWKKDDVSMKELLVGKASFFKKLRGQMGWYYFTFVSCEILNVAMLVINCISTNMFLNDQFTKYGLEAAQFLSKSTEKQRDGDNNPLCSTFPTVTRCDMDYKGTGTGPAKSTGVCILSQNIINQKIYIVLWFWFIIMMAIGTLQILFELSFLSFKPLRKWLITLQMGKFDTNHVRQYVDKNCTIGDWFLLYQIGKNMDKHVFRLFLEIVSQSQGNSRTNEAQSRRRNANDAESQPCLNG